VDAGFCFCFSSLLRGREKPLRQPFFTSGYGTAVKSNLFAVVLVLACVSCREPEERTSSELRRTLASVTAEIVDLTDYTLPLRTPAFVKLRQQMTTGTAQDLARLVESRELSSVESTLAIYAMGSLRDRDYWKCTTNLVSSMVQEEDLLLTIIGFPFEYGPSYARSWKVPEMREVLLALKERSRSNRVKSVLDEILGGEVAREYEQFLRNRESRPIPNK